jgi:transposase
VTLRGVKIQSAKTAKGQEPGGRWLCVRLAQTLEHSESYLGQFFGRMRAKTGRAEAITAVAHKLARIFYTLVRTGRAYDESVLAKAAVRQRAR